MSEELRAGDVFRPPILRPISRDGREERDRRFRERFAETIGRNDADLAEGRRRSVPPHPPSPAPEEDEEPDRTAPPSDEDEERPVGRNLDREL